MCLGTAETWACLEQAMDDGCAPQSVPGRSPKEGKPREYPYDPSVSQGTVLAILKDAALNYDLRAFAICLSTSVYQVVNRQFALDTTFGDLHGVAIHCCIHAVRQVATTAAMNPTRVFINIYPGISESSSLPPEPLSVLINDGGWFANVRWELPRTVAVDGSMRETTPSRVLDVLAATREADLPELLCRPGDAPLSLWPTSNDCERDAIGSALLNPFYRKISVSSLRELCAARGIHRR